MGCDGGTIPRRDELVRLKKKPEQKDKDAELQYRWRHCALTQQRLQEPIVICGLGRLYSKQNVIEALLEKEKIPESSNHLKSMKDIKQLNLTPNPAFNKTEDKNYDVCSAPYICSLIGLEMSGKFRFIALWTCGCVFSERAFKEIRCNVCSMCQTAYSEQDVVILNGSEEDTDAMRVKMDARVARRKSDKKDKKNKSAPSSTVTLSSIESTKPAFVKPTLSASGSKLINTTDKSIPITAAASSSSKLIFSNKPLKRFGKDEGKYDDPAFKKSKDSYSVASDPKATEVYKSLFTTHESEQSQTRAHWVTYNPFYN